MNIEYIPGDFTTWLGRKVRIDGVIVDPDTKHTDYYEIADTGSTSVFQGEDLKPTKLTRTILKKNGWKKPNGFDSYWLGKIGLLQDGEVWHSAIGNTKIAITLGDIRYVHQLQNLLFGLNINHEMEV